MRKLFSRTPSFKPKFSSRIDTDEQNNALVGGGAHHHHSVAGTPLNSSTSTQHQSSTTNNNNHQPINMLFGGELDDSDPNKIPQFILDTIDFLLKYGVQIEGIFRVSTHETRKTDLINKMNDRYAKEKDPHKNCTQPYNGTNSEEVYFASAVLKHYFRSLPTPLIKPQFYETFMLSTKCRDQERNDMLKNAVRLLPVNYYTLLKRISELCFEISKHSSVNKMTCENLSVCWTPNLLINNNLDFMEQMKRTGDAQNVISALFRDYKTIFQQDQEPIKLERKQSALQTKKFFLGLTSQTSQEGIAVYNGEKNENGEKHGKGILMLPNGSVFEGEFRNNKYYHGKLIYVGGEQYEGSFLDDLPHDDNGVFRFANMSTYSGQVKQGQLIGIGEMRYKDGGIYKGSFINGKREGKGSFEFYEGNQKVRHYDGDWENDSMSGQGTLINTNIQQVYTGQFKDNVYHGQGVLISGLEQNRCEGEFENGTIKNGSGSFTSLNNEFIQFEGSWKNTQFTGKIKIFNFQSRALEFEGDMNDSRKNGYGKLVYSDGSYYEGQFSNDDITGTGSFVDSDRVYNGQFVKSLFHGKGKLKTTFQSKDFVFEGEFREHQPYNGIGSVVVSRKTGDYWDGEFKNGKFSGKGRLTFEDASVYEGDVKNSVCEGKGVVTYPDGSIYSGSFSNDERHGPGILTIKDGDEKEYMIVSIKQVWDHGVLVSQEEPQSPATLDEKESLIFAFLDSLEKEEPLRFGPLVGKEQRPYISTALTKAKENPNTSILYEILYQLSKCRR